MRLACILLLAAATVASAQVDTASLPQAPSPNAATVSGAVTDTDGAFIPNAQITLEAVGTKFTQTSVTDNAGAYIFTMVPPGTYQVHISARNFSSWKVKDFPVHANETVQLTAVELGVEEISTAVSAITVEDLAEEQITNEEHQRILGILPNFFVSYEAHPMPLTRKQKFKLAVVVSRDPLTFMTTGITAGIEQANGDFHGYGDGFSGYAQRYAASYGDRLSATFLGAALLPSILHQDPRYFYNGKGSILHRAFYAISTTVICKGDNGKWQPNYSNVLGNIGSAELSTVYYPPSSRVSAQIRLTNTLIGISEGAIGTLFQEFVLKHITHGAPPAPIP
ncbi:MAG: carboxypeptidase-like regulatory domain-containing protein [Acidobacteriota bacterium]